MTDGTPRDVSLGMLSEYERTRHPYNYAKRRYIAGQMLASQAAAMAALDREFIAECELRADYVTPLEAARVIVRDAWSPLLVRYRVSEKAILNQGDKR